MANKRLTPKTLYEQYQNLRMPKEYHQELYSYICTIFKWLNPINHALDHLLAFNKIPILTPTQMKYILKFDEELREASYKRDTLIVLVSMLIFIGMHTRTKDALAKFTRIRELMDNSLLDHMVILTRYKDAIKNRKRVRLSGTHKPPSTISIQESKDWPEEEYYDSAFLNGQTILHLKPYIKE